MVDFHSHGFFMVNILVNIMVNIWLISIQGGAPGPFCVQLVQISTIYHVWVDGLWGLYRTSFHGIYKPTDIQQEENTTL